MEGLALFLENYKGMIGSMATVTTMAQLLAPVVLCNTIRKQGNTNNISITPLIGGLVVTGIMLRYGSILQDSIMIRVTAFGALLYSLYLVCYYIYADNKGKVVKQISYGGAILGAVIIYTLLEDTESLKSRLGMMVTVLLILIIAAPLFKLKKILKTKSTHGMPIPLIITGTISSFFWVLHGIILRNKYLMVQYLVRLGLCAIQLGLISVYPSTPPKVDEKLKKKI